MSFNINRFRDNVNSYGYSKVSMFEVFVQAPPILQNSTINVNGRQTPVSEINNVLRYRIDQVRAPGISLMSSDVNRYAIGPTQKMPFNAQYFDTTFSVLMDRNTDLWDFWYSWINAIFNYNGQEPSGNNLFTGGRIPTYATKYKEEYATTMMIVIYSETGETIKTINLYDAFPSSYREIPLAWNDQQDLMRLSISITYSQYSIVGSNVSNNIQQPTTSSSRTSSTSLIISP